MHRIHHSCEIGEGQSNLSNLFSFWDRLFGTYVEEPAAGHAHLQFGLREFSGRKHTTLPWMLAQPFLPDGHATPAAAQGRHRTIEEETVRT
jgi:sterol desaturase/sphingolipid hydroxylase (fatty acid hydroxylase superfamily)